MADDEEDPDEVAEEEAAAASAALPPLAATGGGVAAVEAGAGASNGDATVGDTGITMHVGVCGKKLRTARQKAAAGSRLMSERKCAG